MNLPSIDELQAQGYEAVRRLPDGSTAALGRLLFTTAIYQGLDAFGWSSRFCFDDPALARAEFERLQTSADVPNGWIARRPQE